MTGSLRVHWRWLVSLLLLVILFIPPRRYAVPSGLPFELDPYRLVIGVLILLWMLSALSDQDMGVRSSSLEGPLLLFIAGVFGSLVVNAGRVSYYEAEVVKELSVLVGYFLAFYLVVNLLRSRAACETALAVLVIGGAVLAALSVIEQRTGWSPFTHLDHYIPFIQPAGVDVKLAAQLIEEGRGTRAFGSAEHPIALGAMFAMLAPVAAALAITQRRMIWVGCLTLLVIGSFGTLSRTPILMFFAWAVMFSIFRWSDSKRFIPLALISLTLVHLAMPGSLGLIRMYFNPARVLKEQSTTPEDRLRAGRIADLGPSLEEARQRPILGHGFGTRITTGERANTRLLDNQWLATLLDTGIVGLFGLAWLLLRYIRLMLRESSRAGPEGAVFAALAGSVFAYGVGMFTFDALAFTQVTLVLFILLAIGSALVLSREPVVVPENLTLMQSSQISGPAIDVTR